MKTHLVTVMIQITIKLVDINSPDRGLSPLPDEANQTTLQMQQAPPTSPIAGPSGIQNIPPHVPLPGPSQMQTIPPQELPTHENDFHWFQD